MGLFGKKEEKRELPKLPPELPKLPRLPALPNFDENTPHEIKEVHQLPSLPNNSFGNKFSQNVIKDAVSGEKEDEEVFDADEFGNQDSEESPRMQKPLQRRIEPPRRNSRTKELEEGEVPPEFEEAAIRVRKAEPIFVRIDKFEDALHLFEKASAKISEMEKMLRDISRIKEEEEKELEAWEREIQSIKQEIEKIDKEIFSKVK